MLYGDKNDDNSGYKRSSQEQQIESHQHTRGRDCPVESSPDDGSFVERTKQTLLLRKEELSQSGHPLDVGTRAHYQQGTHYQPIKMVDVSHFH